MPVFFVPADFTGDPAFHFDDIRGAGEAESSENSLSALQLVHLQDGAGFLQLPFGGSNLGRNLSTHTNTFFVVQTDFKTN